MASGIVHTAQTAVNSNHRAALQNRLYSPIKTAPAISNTVAKKQACLTVSTFDPTEVPKELATSLAPMPKANTNATVKPTMTSQRSSGEKGSSHNGLCIVVNVIPSMLRCTAINKVLPGRTAPYKVFSLTPLPSTARGPHVLHTSAPILFIKLVSQLYLSPCPELTFVKYLFPGTHKYPTIHKFLIFFITKIN